MNTNYECPNCGYDMGPNDVECKYCGTKNPHYVAPAKSFFETTKSNITTSQTNYATNIEYSSKSRIACGLLQIFLGGFGIGRFYSGHTSMGVAQFLVSVFTCGWGSIWGLIDGILILCNNNFKDAEGRIMK